MQGSTARPFSSGRPADWIRVDAGSLLSRSSVVAATKAADVVAVGIELANPAAAAIAVIVIAIVRSDRAADHGGADEACSDAPAEAGTLGFRLGGGGSHAAGDGKCGEGESGNSGLDRHEKLRPVERGRSGSARPVGRSLFESGSNARREILGFGDI